MSRQAWLLFCATEAAVCVTPGPAVLFVVSQSLSRGTRAGLSASFGILAANAAYFVLSATSLGAVLIASWEVFSVIKWIGAAYLVWLGARMIFGSHAPIPLLPSHDIFPRSGHRSFSLAVVTQGANPKALVFFTAILPQFIEPTAPVLPQILILGISSLVIEFVVLGIYIGTCHTARTWVSQPRFASPLQRVGGGFLIGAGLGLAAVGGR
jgi:homoserine/homoserine lactone efflux protein